MSLRTGIVGFLWVYIALLPAAQAACVYKDVMTTEEIAACAQEGAPPDNRATLDSERRGAEARAQIEALKRAEQQQRIDARRAREAEALRNAPVAPSIGMTAVELEQLFARNAKRLDEYHARHDSGSPPVAYWDWSAWSNCDVHRTLTVRGTREQWVCGHQSPHRYVYTDNGIVTAIQD